MVVNTLVNRHVIETMSPLLTMKDLEQLFRVHRRTIMRLCHNGRLPEPIRIGGSNRWLKEDIDLAITGQWKQ